MKKLILIKTELSIFQLGTKNLFTIFPLLLLSGEFFSGKIAFGTIEQGSVSFVSILYALSVLVDQIQKISILRADSERLEFLNEKLNNIEPKIIPTYKNSEYFIETFELSIFTQNDETLLDKITIKMEKKERTFITGPNGSGKTTFLKTIDGHHFKYSGNLEVHEPPTIIPALPFFFPGNVIQQVTGMDKEIEEKDFRENYLPLVNLRGDMLLNSIEGSKGHEFSPGELQKLNLLRVFFHPEKIYIFDETFNFIDSESLSIIFKQFINHNIKYNTVSQNSTLIKYHSKILEFINKKIKNS